MFTHMCSVMSKFLPGPFVHEILQGGILEWVIISFSMGSSWPRDWTHVSCCCCSVSKLCLTLCNPMDCSFLFFTVSQSLLILMFIELVLSSNYLILCQSLFLLLLIFPNISLLMHQSFASGSQNIGASALSSVSPMNIQGWFHLGLTGFISLQSTGLSRVFSNTTVQSINSLAPTLLYGPALTSIHDYWKNHSFDYTDLCWQSNVSAFQYAV